MGRSRLSIVIPVYNEGDNFPGLWKEVSELIKADFTAYAVYDFEEDNTVPAIRAIIDGGERRLRCVQKSARNAACLGHHDRL